MKYIEAQNLARNINLLCGSHALGVADENTSGARPADNADSTVICKIKTQESQTYGDQDECSLMKASSCPRNIPLQTLMHIEGQ